MEKCYACPRACGVERDKKIGFCGGGALPRVSKVMLHRFEEPVISGNRGSGAIFFSGCALRCVFCQNASISHTAKGKEMTVDELVTVMLSLQDRGAHNINLVTASHYIPQVALALKKAKRTLTIPVVFNCSGYESVESLRLLDGLVDVYLPDFKYCNSELSARFSHAPDYREVAEKAIGEMIRQKPKIRIEDGLIQEGVIIRHLVLPGHREDSKAVLERIKLLFPTALVSVMRQYTPTFNTSEYPELNRKVTSFEYDDVLKKAIELGLDGFIQDKGCESDAFTPDFEQIYD
ncbi:MAG: radical SAM protein [Clostridia bacterium]|nr:radical SAM protein [Clostridia bacterium]